jgi:pyruvate/2-oxoglutarate dehydrogenase complex dihydrolipoamide dehydrogenase (E3) component
MFNAATVAETIHTAKNFGFNVEGVTFDWNALKLARDAYITRLNGIYSRNLVNSKVDVIAGTASFSGPKSVIVETKVLVSSNFLSRCVSPYFPSRCFLLKYFVWTH